MARVLSLGSPPPATRHAPRRRRSLGGARCLRHTHEHRAPRHTRDAGARRRPHVLAKQVTTLDHLSRGRAVLGVGLGVPAEEEYGAFGEPIEPKVHGSMLDDGLAVLDGLWQGEPSRTRDRTTRSTVRTCFPPATTAPTAGVGRGALAEPASASSRRTVGRCRAAERQWRTAHTRDRGERRRARDRAAAAASTGSTCVATLAPDTDPAEYEAAGATWAIESIWPWPKTWYDELLARCEQGPLGVTEENA